MTSTPLVPDWLDNAPLMISRGIEKEGLRMAPSGYASATPHPHALGSKLTHPYITTDYSENLLELITPPFDSIKKARDMLYKLHVLVAQNLKDEIMWPLSMPCMLSDDDADILLANFGTSNTGRLKTLYRSGLGVRYGRKMQTIAGVHYNLSFADELFIHWQKALGDTQPLSTFKNAGYLALVRNFKRLSPLVLYLTGASPSVCACFLKGRAHDLVAMNENKSTYYAPYATSLRMGKLGYTNSVQDDLGIYYNDLDSYIQALRQAVFTPFARFTALGVDDNDGTARQINDHILQIENEFYSPIRPKQVTQSGETPTEALKARGIAYVEFRAIDLDPYDVVGISSVSAHFLESVALYCLLSPSAPLEKPEELSIQADIDLVVNEGRKKTLTLSDGTLFYDFAKRHLSAIKDFAKQLDDYHQTRDYSDSVAAMCERLDDPDTTPSARIIKDSQAMGGTWQLGKHLGEQYKKTLLATALGDGDTEYFAQLAANSWQAQTALEESEQMTFAEFLAPYRTAQ